MLLLAGCDDWPIEGSERDEPGVKALKDDMVDAAGTDGLNRVLYVTQTKCLHRELLLLLPVSMLR